MQDDYWSVESILAEKQTTQATFRTRLRGQNWLHPDLAECGEQDVPAGHEMRVPLWAAKVLQRKQAIAIKLPRHLAYKGDFRQTLLLDPAAADLRAKDPRFYLRAAKLSRLLPDTERDTLRQDLKDVYADRFRHIVDLASTRTDKEYSTAVASLDLTDRQLFDKGRGATVAYKQWKSGQAGRIKAAPVIVKNTQRARLQAFQAQRR